MTTVDYPRAGSSPDTSELRSDPEWQAVIGRLRARKSLLVTDFRNRFPAGALYQGKVTDGELDALVSSTMEMYLLLLAGEQLDPTLQRLPQDLGRRRARQGVPSELLLEGVRTNFRVIWNTLREIAPQDAAALVRNTDAVLSLVEWHVREVQSSYLREEDELNRRHERRRQQSVDRIFQEPPPDADLLDVLGEELGIAAGSALDAAVQFARHDVDCASCRGSVPTFAAEVAGGTCHFRTAGRGDLAADLAQQHALLIGNVGGLSRLPDTARAGLALLRARHRTNPAPTTPAETWAALAWQNLTAEVPARLLPLNLDALDGLHADERARLVETVTSFVATGSIKETAEQLYCHRNTIVKRLDRFRALVGLDLRIPRESALAVLALADAPTARPPADGR